jgi:hypothetical protein
MFRRIRRQGEQKSLGGVAGKVQFMRFDITAEM